MYSVHKNSRAAEFDHTDARTEAEELVAGIRAAAAYTAPAAEFDHTEARSEADTSPRHPAAYAAPVVSSLPTCFCVWGFKKD
jgi:hypothetical protein